MTKVIFCQAQRANESFFDWARRAVEIAKKNCKEHGHKKRICLGIYYFCPRCGKQIGKKNLRVWQKKGGIFDADDSTL